MNTIQALSILNPEEKTDKGLKTAYHKACLKHHPDKGGDVEIMKLVNTAYEFLKNSDSWWSNEQVRKAKKEVSLTDTMQSMIDKIKTLVGVKIEIIGSWLWVSGDTFKYKDVLKNMNMKFAGNKKAWYYHEDKTYYKKTKKRFTLNDIRDLHGSVDIKTENNSLAA